MAMNLTAQLIATMEEEVEHEETLEEIEEEE